MDTLWHATQSMEVFVSAKDDVPENTTVSLLLSFRLLQSRHQILEPRHR
jgi:hypothetical protein